MKTSCTWNARPKVGKIMMWLAVAAMIGSTDVATVYARDDGNSRGGHDNGRYEHNDRGHGRDRHGKHYSQPYGYRERVYYPSYGYRERVYYPPPVIYAPPPPPGISIFLPPFYLNL